MVRILAAGLVLTASLALAGPTTLAKCQATKMKAAGKNAYFKAKCQQKAFLKDLPVDPACIGKADDKLVADIQKADAFTVGQGEAPCPGDYPTLQGNTAVLLESLLGGIRDAAVPCPSLGRRIGGACWYVGLPNASCDTTCSDLLLYYDPATETFAGSGGTDANCQLVIRALVGGAAIGFSFSGDCGVGYGYGCSAGNVSGTWISGRCSSPPTTSSAVPPDVAGIFEYRVCACREG